MNIVATCTRLHVYRIVICLTISPPLPVTPPSRDNAEADPGFLSNIFQNLRLSSAANDYVSTSQIESIDNSLPAVASI